jgi:hypothetical protein
MLLDIITVGRDYNVCLLVLAQSLNLEALGLVGDANLRANMAIVAQGLLVKTKDGKTKGDYLLVELAIKNQYIVSDNVQRQMLLAKVNELMPESEAKQIPIFFTTLGNGNVGLLPYIEKAIIKLTPEERSESLAFDVEKFRQYLIQREAGMGTQTTQTMVIDPPKIETEDPITYLERMYDLSKSESTSPPDESPETEPSEPTAEPLNKPQGEASCESEPRFTTLNLNREQALNLIQRLRAELNQTQIIERLWECKKGGSEAWRKAYAQFKDLTKEEGEENNNAQ